MKRQIAVLLVVALAWQAQAQMCLSGEDESGGICAPMNGANGDVVASLCVRPVEGSDVLKRVSVLASDPAVSSVDLSLWVGRSPDQIPSTRLGGAIPPRFQYTCDEQSAGCSATVDLSALWSAHDVLLSHRAMCDQYVWFSAQAQLHASGAKPTVAWAEGVQLTARGDRSSYNYLYVMCDEDCTRPTPPPPACIVAAAHASSGRCLLDVPNAPSFNVASWVNGPFDPQAPPVTFDLLAVDPSLCDASATVVGSVSLSFSESVATVAYSVSGGYGLESSQLHLGGSLLPKVTEGNRLVYTAAPGQFPYRHDALNGTASDTYVIPGVSLHDGVYLSLQAILCGAP